MGASRIARAWFDGARGLTKAKRAEPETPESGAATAREVSNKPGLASELTRSMGWSPNWSKLRRVQPERSHPRVDTWCGTEDTAREGRVFRAMATAAAPAATDHTDDMRHMQHLPHQARQLAPATRKVASAPRIAGLSSVSEHKDIRASFANAERPDRGLRDGGGSIVRAATPCGSCFSTAGSEIALQAVRSGRYHGTGDSQYAVQATMSGEDAFTPRFGCTPSPRHDVDPFEMREVARKLACMPNPAGPQASGPRAHQARGVTFAV